MNGRSFFITLLLGVILVILLIISAGKWNSSIKTNPIVDNQILKLPESAKYIPNDSQLSIYFQIDPNRIPKHIESIVNPKKKNLAKKESYEFIDGLFNLTGIDLNTDLSNWMISRFSISILTSEKNNEEKGWLLIIEGIDDNGPETFLNNYLEAKVNNSIKIKTKEYKGMDIYSTINANGENKEIEISSILIDNNIALIASNTEVLHKAIDVSQYSSENQLGNKSLNESIDILDSGIALITAKPELIEKLFGLPKIITEKIKDYGFTASVMSKEKKIYFDSNINFKDGTDIIINQNQNGFNFSDYSASNSTDVFIINEPINILDDHNSDIYPKLIESTFNQITLESKTPVIKEILESQSSALALVKDGIGWFVESIDNNQVSKIEESLIKAGYTKSTIPFEGDFVRVWSKIKLAKLKDHYSLTSNVDIILFQDADRFVWTNQISMLEVRNEMKQLMPRSNTQEISNINKDGHAIKISLSEDSAQKALNSWGPWKLLKTVNKNWVPNIKGLNLAIGTPNNNDDEVLKIRGILSMN